MKLGTLNAVAMLAALLGPCAAIADDYAGEYEVIERSQHEVPNHQAEGHHTEVSYVLLHDGHKFYATCDATTIGNLDPTASCSFRPLRKYQCRLGRDDDKARSDLLCQEPSLKANVYLYVSKKTD